MRQYLFYLIAVWMFAACSAPKYTYYFDHYDYNAGKKKKENSLALQQAMQEEAVNVEIEPLKLEDEMLTASATEGPVVIHEAKSVNVDAEKINEAAKSYKEMSKTERKEFRREAKKLVKTYIKAKKEGDDVKAAAAAKAMDHDLKLAAIFGAVGLVALLIGGDVFWVLGGIALIIGVVFFVMWLSRQ